MNNKLALGLASVAIVIAIGAYFFPQVGSAIAGATGTRFPSGLSVGTTVSPSSNALLVGTSGTNLAGIVAGNCTIWTGATTIAATTTQQAVCQSATNGGIGALTGVTTDSICNVRMASSTNTTIGGLSVAGISASSTAGTIIVQLANFTGTTFTWTAAASSSSQWTYSCFDPS